MWKELFISLYLVSVLETGSCALPDGKAPKKYVVNLDVSPERRWDHVMADNKDVVSVIHTIITTYLPKITMPYIEKIAAGINKYIEQPYADEMKGIARALNCSVGDMVLATLIYDIAAYCTSIVSQDERGQIWHARNLDYDFGNLLKNVTVEVDFQRNGTTLYSAVTFAGYVGLLTGQRPHAFTVSVNQRDTSSILWNFVIGLLDRQTVPVGLLVRNALTHDQNFTAAVNRLSNTTTAAEAYFIVGGVRPGEGAVISKGHFGPDDIWRLNATEGRWFLVETNYDHWKPVPQKDNRRAVATKAMNSTGRINTTVEKLYKVLSTPKVLNQNTIYSAVMSAAQPSLMQSWIREYN